MSGFNILMGFMSALACVYVTRFDAVQPSPLWLVPYHQAHLLGFSTLDTLEDSWAHYPLSLSKLS